MVPTPLSGIPTPLPSLQMEGAEVGMTLCPYRAGPAADCLQSLALETMAFTVSVLVLFVVLLFLGMLLIAITRVKP